MTVITRWAPLREISSLQDRVNRLFHESYGPEVGGTTDSTGFAPPVDVYEDEHSVTLKIEVPGIDEKDIDVRIENNFSRCTASASSRRKRGRELPRVERIRQLHPHLHAAHDRGCREGSANYDKGILKIALPKKAEAKPKQIKVTSAANRPWKAKPCSGIRRRLQGLLSRVCSLPTFT